MHHQQNNDLAPGFLLIQKQGCQLLRIAWREEPKHEKKYIYFDILQFFLRLRLSNCVSVLTLKKKVTGKKQKTKTKTKETQKLCFL